MKPSSAHLVRVGAIGTVVFALSTACAVAFDGPVRVVGAGVSVALFVLGCITMLWAFAVGVGRSRHEELSVAGLFLLLGSASKQIRRTFLGLTAAQTVIAVIGASIRPFTALAFGILVPMFGLGLTGLWGAHHGDFPARQELDYKRPSHARAEQGDHDG